MKYSLYVLLFVTIAVTSATTFRLRRDVSHLATEPANNYLPPAATLSAIEEPLIQEEGEEIEEPITNEEINAAPAEVETEAETEAEKEAPQDTAVLSDNGYEYKTVRKLRLRYRNRRDVSHLKLNREYLPPVEPSREYLPPPVHEALPLEDEPPQPAPKISNEYLPPVVKAEPIVETEAPVVQTEAPVVVTEAATEPVAVETEAPQDTAILAADGYHYKKPAEVPDLSFHVAPELTREYLPPLEDGVVEAEGPEEESAALVDDGYRYRVVRRLRF